MVSFFIIDYTDSLEKCKIHKTCSRIRKIPFNAVNPTVGHNHIVTDPVKLVNFLLNLRYFPRFRLKAANALVDYGTLNSPVFVKLVPPTKEHLDYHWGERAVRMLWELLELTELMAWLSTLGGAFSALGDYQQACAETAGKISIHQMKLAFRLGDPALVARCQLYLAISLIQKAEFAAAKQIVQRVYRGEKKKPDPETRLLNMCQGIWAKLRYEYDLHQRQEAHRKT
uniref:Uncharacterized protein n=1 Tax=Anopheles atroparvus TaxID=41427 RepID=A0AAG5CZI8_ANOAO